MRAVLLLAIFAGAAFAGEATVVAHDIVLRVDPASGTFVSHDTVELRGPGRLRALASAGVHVSGDGVDVPAGLHEVRVRFSGRLGVMRGNGGHLTRRFYVPSSQPSRFTLTIGVPPPHRAVAPGRCLDEWEAEGLRFVTYAGRSASGGLVVVTGPWETEGATIDGVACRAYARDREQSAKLLATLRDAVPRFNELLGALPGGRFDIVQTGRGCSGFTLLGGAHGDCSETASAEHALAHAWFGHLVQADRAWGDWTESLATYFADHGAAERAGEGAAHRARVARGYSLRVAPEVDYPLRRFVGIRYPHDRDIGCGKGSMVFHMLARELGRDRFLEAARHALETHAGDSFGWDMWVAVLGEGLGTDLAPWFAPWLDRAGAPVLEIGSLKVAGRVITGTIRQAQPGPPYPLRIPVRVTTRSGQEEHVVPSASKETAFRLTAQAPPRRVEIDPDHHVLRRIPRDRAAPCPAAVLTAGRSVGYGDATLLGRLGVERAVGEPPADAALLAVGLPLEIKPILLRGARQQDASLRIESGRFAIRGEVYDRPGDALLFSFHVPGLPPVTLFHGNAAAAYADAGDLLASHALDSWVVFRDGRAVKRGTYAADRATRAAITQARRGEVESLVGDLLHLTDPRHAGRGAGTMAAFKLANELRGRAFHAGLTVLPWPSVRIPRGTVAGRELVILDGDEKVRLPDAFFPFHESASPRNAPVFRKVVEHPAKDVEGALVLLPEDATLELARQYAEQDAAVVAVVARDEACTRHAREAAWEGALPPALRRSLAADRTDVSLAVSDLLVRGDAAVHGFPFIYLRPSAAAELKRRGAGGVLKYAIRRTLRETSNVVGVLGNPRERGVLLGAHWDGAGIVGGRPAPAASDNAAGVAVVLWVAARLKRDFDAGKLERPVVVALFGGNKTGLAGSRQFVGALRSSKCPIARPLCAVNVDAVGSVAGYRVQLLGGAQQPELSQAFEAARRDSGLDRGPDADDPSCDHGSLHAAGIPAVTIFGADLDATDDTIERVDVEAMRRVARVVYRMVRDLASR